MTEPHETFTWYDDYYNYKNKYPSNRNRRITFVRHAIIGLGLVIVWGAVIWLVR